MWRTRHVIFSILIAAGASGAIGQSDTGQATVANVQRSVGLTPQSLTDGSSGDVILNGSITPYGVFLRAANSTNPSIGAQLGSTTSGSFVVFGSDSATLWSVSLAGIAEFRKDQNAVTAFHLNNANPGTSSTGISTAYRFWEGATLKASIASNGSGSSALFGGINALRITNFASGPLLLSANAGDILLYTQTMTHSEPVQFRDATAAGFPLGIELKLDGNSFISVGNLRLGYAAVPVIQSTGATGTAPLRLNWTSDNDVIVGASDFNKGLKVESVGLSSFAGSLSVGGDLSVTGNITARYEDLAEWVPAITLLPAGSVVILDGEHPNHVRASTHAYDTAVAGVVSARPGIALGEAGTSKALIATTGRVVVRVDASRSPIAIGDLLVTSDKPGMAMKSIPIDFQGVPIHRPGTVVGKALEPLESGEGEILVLLSLQ